MECSFVSKIPQEILNPAIDLCWIHAELFLLLNILKQIKGLISGQLLKGDQQRVL